MPASDADMDAIVAERDALRQECAALRCQLKPNAPTPGPSMAVKIMFGIAVGMFSLLQSVILERREHVDQIWDSTHALTEPLSDYLWEHRYLLHLITALHSIVLDGFSVYMVYLSVFRSRSLDVILSVFVLYGCRLLVQHLVMFPMPPKWRFDDPGVPTVMVSYAFANDFYFSGHLSSLTLFVLEMHKRQYRTLRAFGLLVMCFVGLLLLTVRAHYVMDIIDSIFFAVFSYKAGQWAAATVDAWFATPDHHE
eukprot:NODE_3958_length_868_cov_22.901484_g3803_i0.p1 GENE.NODE_3958_length_868_cov_22.901484_g3803_i0~~NODE_3958_length_868_cov_22.901484_g3803_i0.p1  ORF type:complete len:266 (+),score=72.37 NODE_3958_length_868_cov_22.901484_g3803_i0:45-800(+)